MASLEKACRTVKLDTTIYEYEHSNENTINACLLISHSGKQIEVDETPRIRILKPQVDGAILEGWRVLPHNIERRANLAMA